MANPNNCDLTEDRLFHIGTGLIYCVWCAPKTWSAEQVKAGVNEKGLPGTSANEWVISDPSERDDEFNGTNHLPCPDDENRQHWMLNC